MSTVSIAPLLHCRSLELVASTIVVAGLGSITNAAPLPEVVCRVEFASGLFTPKRDKGQRRMVVSSSGLQAGSAGLAYEQEQASGSGDVQAKNICA